MHTQTLNHTTPLSLFTPRASWSPLLLKKAALSLALLTVGGALMMLLAVLWMPTLMLVEVALTFALCLGVLTSPTATLGSVATKSAQTMGVLAIGGAYAWLSCVLLAIFTF